MGKYKLRKNKKYQQQIQGNNYFSVSGYLIGDVVPSATKVGLGIVTFKFQINDMNGTPTIVKIVLYQDIFEHFQNIFDLEELRKTRLTINGYIRGYKNYINLIGNGIYIAEDHNQDNKNEENQGDGYVE